ncbi:alpha/beta hydrolase [Bradyrhizobium sp. WYCCWR 13022]|uniref:alpha/beta fold hydrolase n=1 Tax=unclassified Bradyrhizobium TaxID=2631580 RepID=UPI00263B3A61|nr:alpha/beta hydrolase [Bradyrhizobium sp. WYCCWR 13022]MDN4984304.1 alpha/beta hydrolase [Bradyrhizobium sp. WYCCWR 13022]
MSDDYKSIWTELCKLPLRQDYVDAKGVKTRYINAGPKSAPKVIMLHGMGGSWENLYCNIADHAQHFDTYGYDMVGHGFSDKPDKPRSTVEYAEHLLAFMDAMSIEKASLLGLSLGSWVATKFAAMYPDRVEKVTMVSAWGRPYTSEAEVEKNRALMASSRERRLAAVANPTWQAMDEVFAHLISDPKKRVPDLLALRQIIYRQPEMKRAMENILEGLNPDTWNTNAVSDDEVKKIQNPYLIVAAISHKDVFLESAYAYAKLLKNAQLIEFPGTSHFPHLERASDFNRMNIEFLRGQLKERHVA